MDEPRFVERVALRLHRGHTDVATEHVRAAHGLPVPPEGAGDRVLEKAFAQADARLAAHDLDQVAQLRGGRPSEERVEQQPLRRDAAGRGDLLERVVDVAEAQRRVDRDATGALGQVRGRVSEVGVGLVRRADVLV